MAYEIEIQGRAPQTTAAIRVATTQAEISAVLDRLFPEVWAELERQGVPAAGPPFARWHHFAADRVDLEAGFPVAAPVAGAGRIVAGALPGGRAAVTVHRGPYDTLTEAYHAIEAWAAREGQAAGAAPWEIYLTDPGATPDPTTWRTEVVWPFR